MDITDFDRPKDHPYGMLEGHTHAYEKESALAYILAKNLDSGEFIAVKTPTGHHALVEDGLLVGDENHGYALTEKAKGLLYSVYYRRDKVA